MGEEWVHWCCWWNPCPLYLSAQDSSSSQRDGEGMQWQSDFGKPTSKSPVWLAKAWKGPLPSISEFLMKIFEKAPNACPCGGCHKDLQSPIEARWEAVTSPRVHSTGLTEEPVICVWGGSESGWRWLQTCGIEWAILQHHLHRRSWAERAHWCVALKLHLLKEKQIVGEQTYSCQLPTANLEPPSPLLCCFAVGESKQRPPWNRSSHPGHCRAKSPYFPASKQDNSAGPSAGG